MEGDIMNQFLKKAQELEPLLIAFRRKIHTHPEIGFELNHTKKAIEKELDQAGIHWEEFAGSLIAVIENSPGKTYMIRAEMDALPMDEESGLSFSSKIPGKAHCCGHDLNASMLLGALILLKQSCVQGRIIGLFQAAEETGQGAKRLVDEGFLEKYGIDTGMRMHVNAKAPLGRLGYGKGKMFASNTSFDVVIHGKGSHGARPFEGKDPVNMAVQLYNLLNSVTARETNVFDHNIFSIVSLLTGDSYNVIPDTVTMKCSLRTYDEKNRIYLEKRYQEVIAGMAKAFNAQIDYNVINTIPSLSTTPDFVDKMLKEAQDIIPENQIAPAPEIKYGSEDFAFTASQMKQVASMSIGAGISPEEGYRYGQHNAKVIFNEKCIALGSALQAWWAFQYCGGEIQ